MSEMDPKERKPAYLLEADPANWCPCCLGSGGPRYRGDVMHCTDCHGTGARVHDSSRCGISNCDRATRAAR